MKSMRWLAAIAAILIICLVQLVRVFAANDNDSANKVGSEIIANVKSEYNFTLPPDVTISFPQTEAELGDFVVGELFLGVQEKLKIEIIPGPLTAQDKSSELLYSAEFNPPPEIDAKNSGEKYAVSIKIGEGFASAPEGRYKAELVFRVVSNSANSVVWQDTATVTVEKVLSEDSLTANKFFDTLFWPIAVFTSACAMLALYLVIKKKLKKY